MTYEEQNKLVEQVLRQVLLELRQSAPERVPEMAAPSGKRMLVFGPEFLVPAEIRESCDLETAESYQGPQSLAGLDGVYVTHLSRRDLADIALGRDSSSVSCGVTSALLMGIPVYLLERGLEHRVFASCASNALYRQLEGYVRRLQEFGVHMVENQAPTRQEAGRRVSKLVTEADATALVRSAPEGPIRIPAGTILTPSARDVFRQAGRSILHDTPAFAEEGRL